MTEETMLRDPGPQQIEPLAEAAPGTRCTLIKLTSRTCRWPIGDPKRRDFCFCGATSVRGRPYCGFHLGVASCAGATKVTQANAQDRARPAARRGRTSRWASRSPGCAPPPP
jgi:hypothetical protein